MDYTASYSMLLTRQNDVVSQYTCGIIPVKFADDETDNIPTVVIPGSEIAFLAPNSAMMFIYDVSGRLVRSVRISEGDNNVTMPSASGIYIMKVVYENGKTENSKMVIR